MRIQVFGEFPYLYQGSKEFEFQYSEDFIVAETDIGTCQVAKDGISADLEKTCCSQLGYTYVSENIGIRRITSFNLTSQAEMEKYANQGGRAIPTEHYIFFFGGFVLLLILIVLLIKENKIYNNSELIGVFKSGDAGNIQNVQVYKSDGTKIVENKGLASFIN